MRNVDCAWRWRRCGSLRGAPGRCVRDLRAAALDAARAFPEVNVVLVSDRRMAALHQRFMQIAGPTDVLTFQHGEIVVSVETAQANAARFRSSTDGRNPPLHHPWFSSSPRLRRSIRRRGARDGDGAKSDPEGVAPA